MCGEYRPFSTVYHTPLGLFSMVGIMHSRDTTIVSVPKKKVGILETSRRELSEDVSFGIGTGTGTLLVVEQSSSENRTRGV